MKIVRQSVAAQMTDADGDDLWWYCLPEIANYDADFEEIDPWIIPGVCLHINAPARWEYRGVAVYANGGWNGSYHAAAYTAKYAYVCSNSRAAIRAYLKKYECDLDCERAYLRSLVR